MYLHTVETGRLAYRRRDGESVNDVFDLSRCQLTRRGRTGEIERHRARGYWGVTERERVGLAPRVIDLHPDRNAGVLGGLRPPRQCVQVALVLDDDVARLAELRTVDHHIAGDDQTISALAPARIKPLQSLVRRVLLVAKPFAQRGLHDPIGQHLAARQC
jgi:hypothetical protein